MFIGEYVSPLGDKNRVALPKKLRAQLSGSQIIATRGYERCILLVDNESWDKLLTEVNASPLLNLSVRDTKRFLLGGAHELDLDAQGRFVVPESLMRYADLESNVVFVGVGEWIEIWSDAKWQTKLDYLSTNSADIADRISNIK